MEAKSYEKETKAVLINFNKAKATCKTKNIYFTCVFISYCNFYDTIDFINYLNNVITLLIAVSICFCLIKYKAQQKKLSLFHVTNSKLKKIFIVNVN